RGRAPPPARAVGRAPTAPSRARRRAATRRPGAPSAARRRPGARCPRRGGRGRWGRQGTWSCRGLRELLALVPGGERVDDLVEVALDHRGQLVQGEPDAVIRHAPLREVVGADPLAPLAGSDLAAAVRRDGGG